MRYSQTRGWDGINTPPWIASSTTGDAMAILPSIEVNIDGNRESVDLVLRLMQDHRDILALARCIKYGWVDKADMTAIDEIIARRTGGEK